MSSSSQRPESVFPLWRRGIPRLAKALKTVKRLEGVIEEDDVPAQLAVIDAGLRVNREIRDTLLAEMKVRREIVELRKLELDGMGPDEIEALLMKTAKRRGYRHIDGIRQGLVAFLTERGASEESALAIVDVACPMPRTDRQKKRMDRSIGQSYDRLQEELDEGVREVREVLTPSTDSDSDPQGQKDPQQPKGD